MATGRKSWERWYTGYLYLLPGFLIYALFVLWPIGDTLRYSFYDWDGLSPEKFVGLSNYVTLTGDTVFLTALRNNLVFILFYSLLPIALALVLTGLLTHRPLRGMNVFRVGLFVPQVMSMVVVGVTWRWIYRPDGPANDALRLLGLSDWARPWLGDFTFALPAVGVVGTWVEIGFCLVLFIAGVQRIERAIYEAAQLDGANGIQQFWYVTLPSLRAEISVALITTLIAALRVFDLTYVTTRGGPGNSTMVAALYIFRNAFQINRVGYAASLAVVLTILVLVISSIVLIVRERESQT